MSACERNSATPAPVGERPPCPVSGFLGEPVAWRTVAALSGGPIPPKQDFWLCRDPECELVYFGAAGARLILSDLRVRPGFKSGGDLLCYCFLFRRPQLEAELATAGATSVPDQIAALVTERGCACEVRHPAGTCCLREVRTLVREILKR